MANKNESDERAEITCSAQANHRRTFLRLTGGAALAAVAIGIGGASAQIFGNDANVLSIPMGTQNGAAVDLGSGDTGILNYAYALEQLEAAFYTQAVAQPYKNMSGLELQVLTDLRDHEIVHREFFKAALGANAIPALTPNFSKIKFNDRKSVLGTAQVFEDLGVAAYNGAGKLLQNPDFLLLAGKIVSVEARHAAAIRDLIRPRTGYFAPDALDKALDPPTVLKAAGGFIATKITANNLPKA